jgi:hypothetical protein
MKIRFKALTFILLAVITASACAPAVTSAPSVIETPTQIIILELPTLTAPATLRPTSPPTETAAAPIPTIEVQPIATSRGPDLEATDPTTVSLASGNLQLVEFFRFT